MRAIESKGKFEEVKNSSKKTVFLFSADWCPDCRIIEPFLPELEENFVSYQFFYVNRDEFIEICQELDVFGIPSFIAFQEGKEINRFVSKDRKTKEQIEEFLLNL